MSRSCQHEMLYGPASRYPNHEWREAHPGAWVLEPKKHEQLELPLAQPIDTVERPPHYTDSSIETIEAIEAWGLNYRLGNVVKYLSRAGKKDPAKRLEDLRKAAWYLQREIEKSS